MSVRSGTWKDELGTWAKFAANIALAAAGAAIFTAVVYYMGWREGVLHGAPCASEIVLPPSSRPS